MINDCEHEWKLIDQYNKHIVLCKCNVCGVESQFEQKVFPDE